VLLGLVNCGSDQCRLLHDLAGCITVYSPKPTEELRGLVLLRQTALLDACTPAEVGGRGDSGVSRQVACRRLRRVMAAGCAESGDLGREMLAYVPRPKYSAAEVA